MALTVAQSLVSKFNVINGTLLRTGDTKNGNTENSDKMQVLLDKGMTVDTICNYIEDWHEENPNPVAKVAMPKFFAWALGKEARKEQPKHTCWVNGNKIDTNSDDTPKSTPKQDSSLPTPPKTDEKIPVTPNAEQGVTGILTGVVNLVADTVEERMTGKIEKLVNDRVDKMPRREIIVNYNGVKNEVKGLTHKKFEDVLFAVTHGLNVMLVGPAGSGKNILCEQVAESMGIPYRFTNAITYEHQLMGFTDANGVYQATPFYDIWTNGGLFDLDEADGSSQEVFLKLNAALSGDTADFPAPIGNVKRHKDCHIIATANTYGLGADYDYVGRNVLDAASLNRFIQIYIDYDPVIEEAMANGDNDLLSFSRDFRKACRELGIRTILSYRNIKNMATMAQAPNIKKSTVLDYCLTGALKYDDLYMIDNKRADCGAWGAAFHSLVGERKKMTA